MLEFGLLELRRAGFCGRRKTGSESPEKNPRSKDENQQRTLLAYDADSITPWLETSALNSGPFLFPYNINTGQ